MNNHHVCAPTEIMTPITHKEMHRPCLIHLGRISLVAHRHCSSLFGAAIISLGRPEDDRKPDVLLADRQDRRVFRRLHRIHRFCSWRGCWCWCWCWCWCCSCWWWCWWCCWCCWCCCCSCCCCCSWWGCSCRSCCSCCCSIVVLGGVCCSGIGPNRLGYWSAQARFSPPSSRTPRAASPARTL